MSYGPALPGFGGIVTYNSLNRVSKGFGADCLLGKSLGEKLLEIMDTTDTHTLGEKDAQIFHGINKAQPWLLTEREILLLRMLQKRAA